MAARRPACAAGGGWLLTRPPPAAGSGRPRSPGRAASPSQPLAPALLLLSCTAHPVSLLRVKIALSSGLLRPGPSPNRAEPPPRAPRGTAMFDPRPAFARRFAARILAHLRRPSRRARRHAGARIHTCSGRRTPDFAHPPAAPLFPRLPRSPRAPAPLAPPRAARGAPAPRARSRGEPASTELPSREQPAARRAVPRGERLPERPRGRPHRKQPNSDSATAPAAAPAGAFFWGPPLPPSPPPRRAPPVSSCTHAVLGGRPGGRPRRRAPAAARAPAGPPLPCSR